MTAIFYNEFDPYCTQWLSNLIAAGHIPAGVVDGRDIKLLTPDDVATYSVCHFFAGIGGWPYALTLAGWPTARPVWSASCPCQPFSQAGQRRGIHDERHLWPVLYNLIKVCRPPTLFGEQVASADGRRWLAGVFADLEELGYAVAGADLCATGVGAPHIRQRLYWVANASDAKRRWRNESQGQHGLVVHAPDRSSYGGMADARRASRGQPDRQVGHDDQYRAACQWHKATGVTGHCCATRGLGDADNAGLQGRRLLAGEYADQRSPWAASVAIRCLDGKLRRVPADEAGEPEPSLFPLAHGVPGRVGRLRAYGNAIVPHVAATFVRAFLETEDSRQCPHQQQVGTSHCPPDATALAVPPNGASASTISPPVPQHGGHSTGLASQGEAP